jgi:hypothetical protein
MLGISVTIVRYISDEPQPGTASKGFALGADTIGHRAALMGGLQTSAL